MKIERKIKLDVLVMGAGIAGIMAAIQAASQGAVVGIASSTHLFSGSSFYRGTWGLGLIGPKDEDDKKDLFETISRVGMGMTKKDLVHTFVEGITPGIAELLSWGLVLKKPENDLQEEFIPCFDHKNRSWYGILQDSAKKVLAAKLQENQVQELPGLEIIDIIKKDGKVTGAIGIDKEGFLAISCKALVIASGGLGGLFSRCLNSSDIQGMGQYLALKSGASLTNIEFMQMMPGYITPCYKTIFNEKAFQYARYLDPKTNKSIFTQNEIEVETLLKERSTHGPFTSRLSSKEVDFAIYNQNKRNEEGVKVQYLDSLKNNHSEFTKEYFDWLKREKNLTIEDPVFIGIFYHASNGGILIDTNARTPIKGLFACGEATGGMHGADRIGGLSTANGLVFGRIAGINAGKYALEHTSDEMDEALLKVEPMFIPNAKVLLDEIRVLNSQSAMIGREKKQINTALNRLDEIEHEMEQTKSSDLPKDMSALKESYRLCAALTLSKCLLQAISLRKESRGSHYRVDYQDTNEKMNYPIVISLKDGKKIYFDEK